MECQECGKTISDRAADCPHCGTSVRSTSGGRDGPSSPASDTRSTDTGTSADSSDERPARESPSGSQRGPTGDRQTGRNQSARQGQGQPQGPPAGQGRPAGQGQPAGPGGRGQGQPAGQPGGGGQGQAAGRGQPAGQGQAAGRGQPAGQGQAAGRGQPGQPPGGPPGGAAAGHGGGYDIKAKLGELPLKMSALAGAGAALVVGVLGFVFAVVYPDVVTQGPLSTVDAAILTLFDFQFVTPEGPGGTPTHIAPYVFGHFDEYVPAPATLGVLYVLPALVCYRAGNFVAGFQTADDPSHLDSALAGASVVAGYFPLMLVAAVLAPSDAASVDVATALLLAGLVYPLLFGGLGGVVAGYYYPGELRVGQAYSAAVLVLSLVLVFLTTFLTVENIPGAADEMVGRVLTTVFLTVGALALELDVSGTALLPYVVTVGLFLGFGVLRVRRSSGVRSAVEGFAKGATLAPTYALYAAFVFSASVALGHTYLFGEYPEPYAVVGAAVESDALGGMFATGGFSATYTLAEVGAFVEAVLLSAVVYGVVVAGAGGALAWWYDDRDTAGAGPPRSQHPQGGGRPPR